MSLSDAHVYSSAASHYSWEDITIVSPGVRNAASIAYDAGHNCIILFGGVGTNYTNDTWKWNGTEWSNVTPTDPSKSPPARSDASIAYDASHNCIILFGGRGTNAYNDTWKWNGTEWSNVTPTDPSKNSPIRYGASMAYDASNNCIILFGGYDNAAFNDTWKWDGTEWSNVTPTDPSKSPPAREFASMAYDTSHNCIILFGGYGDTAFNDTWKWNGSEWSNVTPTDPSKSPSTRYGASMAYDTSNNCIILFGGVDSTSLNDTWKWNGTEWTFVPLAVSPSKRYFAHMAGPHIILFGGYDSNYMNDTWGWNGNEWTELIPNNFSSRYGGTMSYDASNKCIILFGGYVTSNMNDTWKWNGTKWTDVTPTDPTKSPPRRNAAAMAYDASHNCIILFGGYNSTPLNDTWSWNGTEWSNVTPADPTKSPSVRTNPTMAYDARHNCIILFGGGNSSGLLNDTWVWNGTEWSDVTPTDPTKSPPIRACATMEYDGENMILFGGQGDITDINSLNDTWKWNGTEWSDVTPTDPTKNPAERRFASMAYDVSRNCIIMFGGSHGLSRLNDTWKWNGIEWSDITPAVSPSGRSMLHMAYDANNNCIILFGGLGNDGIKGDTWKLSIPFPTAPRNFIARTESTAKTVNIVCDWTPPASSGVGETITAYTITLTKSTVTRKKLGASTITHTEPGTSTSYTFSNISPDTLYTASLTATNSNDVTSTAVTYTLRSGVPTKWNN